jgi:hypothetical protein
MEKPPTVYELEAFRDIYSEVRKTAFEGYADIKKRRLKYLNRFDRFLVKNPLRSIFGGLILGAGLTVAVAEILQCFNTPSDWVDLWISVGTILVQIVIFFIYWRLCRFKGSPMGEYKFYLEAKRLKESYTKKGYQLSSLRFALGLYIKDKDFGVKTFSGTAAALLLYLKIDSAVFGESHSILGAIIQWLGPVDGRWNDQLFFGLMYLSFFLFALFWYYVSKIWAEQVKSSLDLICEQEKSKTSGSDA